MSAVIHSDQSQVSQVPQVPQDIPQDIADLLKQQEIIQQKLEVWRKEQEAKKMKIQEKTDLQNFIGVLGKKRAFNGLKYDKEPPVKLRKCFHNIKYIQTKEENLAKERAQIKEDCIKEIKDYLDEFED